MRYGRASPPSSWAWPSGFGPARGGCIVRVACLDPARAFFAFLALPERRVGLEIIHQEFRRFEGCLAMRRRRHHQHAVLAWRDAAEPVNDGEPLQQPARQRLVGVAPDLGLRHAGIMLERQRGDRFAVLAAAADAAERDDGADIGAAFGERRDFLRDVEIRLLDANGRRDGHMKAQPPVIGGKNAISRAPDITASGLTWAWS